MRPVILCEEMIIGLVFRRAHVFGYGLVPLIGIGEDRIDIKDHAAKIKQAMLDDLANLEFGAAPVDGVLGIAGLFVGLSDRFAHWRDFRLGFSRNVRRLAAAEQSGEALSYSTSMAHYKPM